jgi:hypothetical protein
MMATRLESFCFIGPRKRRYPFDEWMDGSIWQITRGEDFTCQPHYIVARLKELGVGKYRLNLSYPVDGDADVIVFQFVKRDESPAWGAKS